MKYITGVHALNIDNSLNTCGDWHTSALDWQNIELVESESSIFEDWGIETNKEIPEHTETYNVADDLRAILDLMADGHLGYLKGFRNDFICTDEYNQQFFNKVYQLKELTNWEDISNLMKNEFMWEWIKYLDTKK